MASLTGLGGGTILIVDEDPAMRDSLGAVLSHAGLRAKAFVSSEALLDSDLQNAGCVVTELRNAGVSALELQAMLQARGYRLPLLVLTDDRDVLLTAKLLRAGAADVGPKPIEEEHLLAFIRRALAKPYTRLESDVSAAVARGRAARLTPREREVMELLVSGRTNKEIGRELGISPRTIDVHRARVFQKMQADTLPNLVRLASAAAQR